MQVRGAVEPAPGADARVSREGDEERMVEMEVGEGWRRRRRMVKRRLGLKWRTLGWGGAGRVREQTTSLHGGKLR